MGGKGASAELRGPGRAAELRGSGSLRHRVGVTSTRNAEGEVRMAGRGSAAETLLHDHLPVLFCRRPAG